MPFQPTNKTGTDSGSKSPNAESAPRSAREHSATSAASSSKSASAHHDTTREIFETVVFVVVLVLMLKLFVAEAFVIPTGSMASTLWGDQVVCRCRECGHVFPINASQDSTRVAVRDYTCEN